MTVKPRGNMEIKMGILSILRDGETVFTKIQYKAQVSNTVLSRYLSSLKDNGLIKEFKHDSSNAKRYSLTEKGEEYLKMIEDLDELLHY